MIHKQTESLLVSGIDFQLAIRIQQNIEKVISNESHLQ